GGRGHGGRVPQVLSGLGAERHLQRLRHAALAAGEPLPEIFLDPAYAQATHFRLCTLQVTPPGPQHRPPDPPNP
ncbi:CPT2 palmitoyltransferase, partial [Atlantisia rogersi]|nr:CPT2 palmitoyltransferase [Atlantisia rogersi]